jgi:hypothetical protein
VGQSRSCCCPLILLAVSIDNASGKMDVKLIKQSLARKLRRLTMLRFGNEKAMPCPLILYNIPQYLVY